MTEVDYLEMLRAQVAPYTVQLSEPLDDGRYQLKWPDGKHSGWRTPQDLYTYLMGYDAGLQYGAQGVRSPFHPE